MAEGEGEGGTHGQVQGSPSGGRTVHSSGRGQQLAGARANRRGRRPWAVSVAARAREGGEDHQGHTAGWALFLRSSPHLR